MPRCNFCIVLGRAVYELLHILDLLSGLGITITQSGGEAWFHL